MCAVVRREAAAPGSCRAAGAIAGLTGVVGGYCQTLETTPANGVRVLRDLKPPAPVSATVAPEAECDDDGCTDIFRDYF